ncbi:hypothetical protein NI40_008890 [Enterobacter sp. E20]|nr:hypothetical protein NI40_008890 [Enterobacter sp. E20]
MCGRFAKAQTREEYLALSVPLLNIHFLNTPWYGSAYTPWFFKMMYRQIIGFHSCTTFTAQRCTKLIINSGTDIIGMKFLAKELVCLQATPQKELFGQPVHTLVQQFTRDPNKSRSALH